MFLQNVLFTACLRGFVFPHLQKAEVFCLEWSVKRGHKTGIVFMISCLSSCLFVCLSIKYTYLVFLYKKVLSNGWMDPIKDMFIYTYIHIKAKVSEIL